MILHRGERFRLYPTVEQINRLTQWDNSLRWLWNQAHTERLAKLHAGFLVPGAFDQINQLTVLRKSIPWLADVPRNVCAQLLIELEHAWQQWFRKIAGMPQYKSKNRKDRAPMIESHAKLFRIEGIGRKSSLVFPKLGAIRAIVHRAVLGTAKTCALVLDGDAWFACVACEQEVPNIEQSSKRSIGIDRGVINFIADSDGVIVPNLRPVQRMSAKLARARRRSCSKLKGSQNRKKANMKAAVLHRKARRQREHVLHCLSNQYAKNHGTLVVEKLNIGNMTASGRGTVEEPGVNVRQKAGLNRAILDSGWGRFVYMLKYKSMPLGGRVIEVNPAYSSQECAKCGHIARENRHTQSKFECVSCGHQDHADTNAAKVILSRGNHGAKGCGGDVIRQPMKQQPRVAKRVAKTCGPGPDHD